MSIQHKMVLIKVSKFVKILTKKCQCKIKDISAEEFLTMVCSEWRIDTNKANQYPYAAAVYRNKIYAVLNVKQWINCGDFPNGDKNRSRFVGSPNEKLTKKYDKENVADLYGGKGFFDPIGFAPK